MVAPRGSQGVVTHLPCSGARTMIRDRERLPDPGPRHPRQLARAVVQPGGVPGVLKNAIDRASRPPGGSALNGKPAAIMGATSGGTGTARAQLALRQSFVFTDTRVLLRPEVLVSRAHEKVDADGRVGDEPTRRAIATLLAALVEWTRRVGAGPTGPGRA